MRFFNYWPVIYSVLITFGLLIVQKCVADPKEQPSNEAIKFSQDGPESIETRDPEIDTHFQSNSAISIAISKSFVKELTKLVPTFSQPVNEFDGKQKTVGTVTHSLSIDVLPKPSDSSISLDAFIVDNFETRTSTRQRNIEVGMFGQSRLQSMVGISLSHDDKNLHVSLNDRKTKISSRLGLTNICLHRRTLARRFLYQIVKRSVNKKIPELEHRLNTEALKTIRETLNKPQTIPLKQSEDEANHPLVASLKKLAIDKLATQKELFVFHFSYELGVGQKQIIAAEVDQESAMTIALVPNVFFNFVQTLSRKQKPVDVNSLSDVLETLLVIETNDLANKASDLGLSTNYEDVKFRIKDNSVFQISVPVICEMKRLGNLNFDIEFKHQIGDPQPVFKIGKPSIESNGEQSPKLTEFKAEVEKIVLDEIEFPFLVDFSDWKKTVLKTLIQLGSEESSPIMEMLESTFSEPNLLNQYKFELQTDASTQRVLLCLKRDSKQ